MAKLLLDSHNSKGNVAKLSDSRPANGGNGTYSYSKNSCYQRLFARVEMEKIDEEITGNFDIKNLSSVSNTIRLADLGCAAGPNTFFTMQHIILTMKQTYLSQSPNSPLPEFQLFFNDQVTNDFNTLFRSLPPESGYFAFGVPGSFHHRLFPTSSLHFVYTSYAIHWLSRLPKELRDESSRAWNKGRIHYLGAPKEVVNAYAAQFAKDMEDFLSARAQELVGGGIMVIITSCNPDGISSSQLPSGLLYKLLASCLMDMSKEGLVNETQVDSFNLPIYITCPAEMTEVIEKNGNFSIERMEISDPATWLEGPVDNVEWINHIRAAMEGIFIEHFGNVNIIDEMFERVIVKLEDHTEEINSKLHEKVQLFALLKRKM